MTTTLFVASAGGHLEQALLLRRRLAIGRCTWVTYEVEQTSNLGLETGENVIYAHHPTTRNVPNLVRNYQLARRVIVGDRFERIVSTGAAVAVPFIIEGVRAGIPCHYIESATRRDGPSLSGRILQTVRSVHLYRQSGSWGGRHWLAGPSALDGYAATLGHARTPSTVTVSLGTHHFPFNALVARVRMVTAGLEPDAITWQLGSTPAPEGMSGRIAPYVAAGDLRDRIACSDVVIGHAGVGLVLTALAAGKVPVIVPRRRSRGEHTDDHQVQLAAELERRGLAVVAEVGELSGEHLERAAGLVVTYDEPPPFALAD